MADGWGKKTLERLSVDLKTLPKISQSSFVQSPTAQLNNYTKSEEYAIAKSSIAQLPEYNFELPIKHLAWTLISFDLHKNVILEYDILQ